MDLLAVTVEEHTTLILRVSRVLDHIDVAVVVELTLLLTCLFLTSRTFTLRPEATVQFTDRIVLTNGGQGILDVPPTNIFESVGVQFCPGQSLTLGGREETDHGITVTIFQNRLPETIVFVARLRLVSLLKFLLEELEVALGITAEI